MNWQIHSLGFGPFLADALEALKMIFGSSLFSSEDGASLVAIGIFILFVMTCLRIIMKKDMKELIPMFIAVVAFMLFFQPRVTVEVVDLFTDHVIPVQDVPLGVALAGSGVTSVAMALTEQFQIAYDPMVGEEQILYTTNGFMHPFNVIMAMRFARMAHVGPDADETMRSYMDNCVIRALTEGRFNGDSYAAAPAAYFFMDGDLGPEGDHSDFRGIVSVVSYAGGERTTSPLPCRTAARHLNGRVEAFRTAEAGNSSPAPFTLPGYLCRQISGKSGSCRDDDETLDTSLRVLLGSMYNSQNFLLTQIATNQMRAEQAGIGFGADPYVTALLTEGFEQQRIDSAAAASGFQNIMFYTTGFFMFLFLATSPLILFMTIIRGVRSITFFASWLLMGLWASSNLLVAQLINFYSARNAMVHFHPHGSVGWGDTTLEDGAMTLGAEGYLYTLTGFETAYHHLGNIVTTANFFMGAAPILTLVLLTGSIYPMVAMASRMAGQDYYNEKAGHTAMGGAAAAEMGARAGVPDNTQVSGGYVERVVGGPSESENAQAVKLGEGHSAAAQAAHTRVDERAERYDTSLRELGRVARSAAQQWQREHGSGSTMSHVTDRGHDWVNSIGDQAGLSWNWDHKDTFGTASEFRAYLDMSAGAQAAGTGAKVGTLASDTLRDAQERGIVSGVDEKLLTDLREGNFERFTLSDRNELSTRFSEKDNSALQQAIENVAEEGRSYAEARTVKDTISAEYREMAGADWGITVTPKQAGDYFTSEHGLNGTAGAWQDRVEDTIATESPDQKDRVMDEARQRGYGENRSRHPGTNITNDLKALMDVAKSKDVHPEVQAGALRTFDSLMRTIGHSTSGSTLNPDSSRDVDPSTIPDVNNGVVEQSRNQRGAVEHGVDSAQGKLSEGVANHRTDTADVIDQGEENAHKDHITEEARARRDSVQRTGYDTEAAIGVSDDGIWGIEENRPSLVGALFKATNTADQERLTKLFIDNTDENGLDEFMASRPPEQLADYHLLKSGGDYKTAAAVAIGATWDQTRIEEWGRSRLGLEDRSGKPLRSEHQRSYTADLRHKMANDPTEAGIVATNVFGATNDTDRMESVTYTLTHIEGMWKAENGESSRMDRYIDETRSAYGDTRRGNAPEWSSVGSTENGEDVRMVAYRAAVGHLSYGGSTPITPAQQQLLASSVERMGIDELKQMNGVDDLLQRHEQLTGIPLAESDHHGANQVRRMIENSRRAGTSE